uniref:Uncharacterized protein n=1 Tax=Kalanchoe fedtschenkoi TaxID=63787 RepID=A0A7N0RCV4_KALFE
MPDLGQIHGGRSLPPDLDTQPRHCSSAHSDPKHVMFNHWRLVRRSFGSEHVLTIFVCSEHAISKF